jgi:hypothetical protein
MNKFPDATKFKKYIRVTRNNIDGSYIERVDNLIGLIEGEIISTIDDNNVGDSLILTVVEMTEEEYNSLPEFEGW